MMVSTELVDNSTFTDPPPKVISSHSIYWWWRWTVNTPGGWELMADLVEVDGGH